MLHDVIAWVFWSNRSHTRYWSTKFFYSRITVYSFIHWVIVAGLMRHAMRQVQNRCCVLSPPFHDHVEWSVDSVLEADYCCQCLTHRAAIKDRLTPIEVLWCPVKCWHENDRYIKTALLTCIRVYFWILQNAQMILIISYTHCTISEFVSVYRTVVMVDNNEMNLLLIVNVFKGNSQWKSDRLPWKVNYVCFQV